MRSSRFTEGQIIGILAGVKAGASGREVCRRQGVSENELYRWKRKYGGMDINQVTPGGTGGREPSAEADPCSSGPEPAGAGRSPGKEVVTARERRRAVEKVAAERPRWIHTLLRREDWPVNRKRVQRICREENVAVRRRSKKQRGTSIARQRSVPACRRPRS
jgi:putative transposase